jgi:hypothetical protein
MWRGARAMSSRRGTGEQGGGTGSGRGPGKPRARRRGGRSRRPMTIREILAWADEHRRLTGRWPRCDSEPKGLPLGETWGAIQSALNRGLRNLPSGSTLARLLAEHEEIEADEAAERYDRALDCSPAFERHRRYQCARHRELLRTLETLRKMRKEEFGTENGKGEMADGKWQMTEGKWQMADDRGQMADGKCRMADDRGQMADDRGWITDDGCEVRSGGCSDRESGEPPQAPSEDGVASGEWRVKSEWPVVSGQ